MEKVLLAIDGIKPTRKAFRQAVQLCQRLRTELNVLQIIRTRRCKGYIKKVHRRMEGVKKYLEGSMMAVTFAEAGEHETADQLMVEARKNLNELLPESERAGVPFHLTLKCGVPDEEIIHYVQKNRDVVLTIYDEGRDTDPERASKPRRPVIPRQIRQNLATPLVVVRD
jgi:nucleotide-binding universal stress UspA family protein